MSARDNGLRASAYTVLIEIEASLGDRLLSALAERQIAAYVVPATGPGGATRLILHVDALLRVPAGIVLAGLTPALAGELPAESESPTEAAAVQAAESADSSADLSAERLADDAAFAELVAGYHRTPTERTWPDAEDLPADPGPPTATPPRPAATPPSSANPYAPPAAEPSPKPPFDPKSDADRRRPARPPRAESATPPPVSKIPAPGAADADEDDPEDRYIPPPLPPLDPPSAPTRWALLGLALGLVLMLLPTFITVDHQTGIDIVGVLCVLGSTGFLLSRLRDRSPDDPDDGAVV